MLLQQARSAVTGASSAAATAPAPVRDSLTEALNTGASSGRVSEVVTEWERRGSAPPLSRSASACSSTAASPTAASPTTTAAVAAAPRPVADDAGAERGVAAVDHLLSLLDRLRDERDACKRQADGAAAAHARSMAAVEAEKAELQASVASYGELVKEKKKELRDRIETLEAEKEEMRLQLQAHEEAAAAAAAAAAATAAAVTAPATPAEKVSAASQTEAVSDDDESVYTDSESDDDEDGAGQEVVVSAVAPPPPPLRTGFVTLLFNLPCPDGGVGRRRVSSSSAASSTTSLDMLDDTDAGSLSPASAAASAAPASEASEGASSVQVSSVLRVTEADTVRSVAERAAQVLSRKYDVQVDLGAMCLRVGQDELAMEPPQAVKALVRAASGGCCCGTAGGRARGATTTTPPSASAQPGRGRASSRLGRSRSGSAGGVLRGRSSSATRLQGEPVQTAPRELRSDCGRELRSFPFVRALLEAQQGSAPFHFTAAFVEGVASRPLLGRGASFARAGLAGGKPYGLAHYAQQQQQQQHQQLLHTSLRDSMRDGGGPAALGASARFSSPLQRAPMEVHRRL